MKIYIRLIFVAASILFILNRFVMRPWVLDHDTHAMLVIITNSAANFFEAVVGVILLTRMGFALRARATVFGRFNEMAICNGATMMAALYTLTQEFKLHNLGGNNVFDYYDVGATILGLALINRVIGKFGMETV